eukprot:Pgem_evm3s621
MVSNTNQQKEGKMTLLLLMIMLLQKEANGASYDNVFGRVSKEPIPLEFPMTLSDFSLPVLQQSESVQQQSEYFSDFSLPVPQQSEQETVNIVKDDCGCIFNVNGWSQHAGKCTGDGVTEANDECNGTGGKCIGFNEDGVGCPTSQQSLPISGEPVESSGKWGKLIWSDEFNNGNKINDEVWNGVNKNLNVNGEHQTYNQNHHRIENGNLILKATRNENSNWWTSGRFNTRGKKEFTYGYFETRCKMPALKGAFPAVWMLVYGVRNQ